MHLTHARHVAKYRLKDLARVPNLLSAARVPLAIAFPLAAANAPLAIGVLGLAALTDLLDGWAARRMGQATKVGALVDGLADRSSWRRCWGRSSPPGHFRPYRRCCSPRASWENCRSRSPWCSDRKANRLGKVATALEVATVLAVIASAPGKTALLGATALRGAAAAIAYWRREIRAVRPEHTALRRANAREGSLRLAGVRPVRGPRPGEGWRVRAA